MEERVNSFDELLKDGSSYLRDRQELIKLQVTEKVAKISAGILSFFIILPFFIMGFLFISFSLAELFAEFWGHEYAGYLTVTTIYILAGLLLIKFRKNWLVRPIMNSIIKMILSK